MNNGGKPVKKWVLAPGIPEEIDRALGEYPPSLRQVLFNRGFQSVEAAAGYLAAESPIYSPFQLTGMERAVERILKAIGNNEIIAVYGDYDVDGVTATVLLVEVIRKLGGDVQKYIPDRFDEGYGLNCEALEKLAAEGCQIGCHGGLRYPQP